MKPQARNLFVRKVQPEVVAICHLLAGRLISQIAISNQQLIVYQWVGYFFDGSSRSSTRSATTVTAET